MRPPLAVLLAAFVLTAAPAGAQTPCVGGMAGSYPCSNVDLLGHVPRSTFGSGQNAAVWGWTDPQTGREYAIVGNESGTGFVDVTVPTAPVYLGKMPTQTFPSTWREMRVYADHVFSVSDGAGDHGMQVMDLTRLRDVTSPPVTFAADHVYHGPVGHRVGSVHTISLDESNGLVALNGSGDCAGGPHLVDVTNPLSPVFRGCYSANGYSHDAVCVLYEGPDAAHFGKHICVGFQGSFFGNNHIVVIDVTNPASPTLIGVGTYPNPGYTHQGWFTDDFRYMLINDELDDAVSATWRTIVMDMTDLDNPSFDFIHYGSLAVTDHNLFIRGRYAYESNYEGGLRILDLSGIDGGTLTEVAYFDTYPQGNAESFRGQWGNYPYFASGTILANDRDNGLFVLRNTLLQAVVPDIEPVSPPVVLPPSGGQFSYTVRVTNTGPSPQTFDAWVMATLPNGNPYGPVAGPVAVTLPAGGSAMRTLRLRVPGAAPAGTYALTLDVGDYPAVVDASDSFTFTKQAATAAAGAAARADGPVELAAEGEFFGAETAVAPAASAAAGRLSVSPNPARGRSTVGFALEAEAAVRLSVLDALGREVALLAEGTLPAGDHAYAFEGADLPAGLYLARLEVGGRVEVRRFTVVR